MLLSMSPKELNRVDVIRDINERRLRQKDAAELVTSHRPSRAMLLISLANAR